MPNFVWFGRPGDREQTMSQINLHFTLGDFYGIMFHEYFYETGIETIFDNIGINVTFWVGLIGANHAACFEQARLSTCSI
jgi:hypothetical protein